MEAKLILLIIFLATICIGTLANAAAGNLNSLAAQTLIGFCGGAGTQYSGVIPATSVGMSNLDTSSLIVMIAAVIMTILIIMGILYMVGSILNMSSLKERVKGELLETIGTLIIIIIFIGGTYSSIFLAAQSISGGAITNERSVFVDDCAILTGSSISLIPAMLTFSIIKYVMSAAQSITIKVEPNNFGFEISPLAGLSFSIAAMNQISSITSLMLLFMLSVVFLLSLVYSLFPLLLYVGIFLRAIPWFRAMGGALIAMFIGFYILFPMLLLVTLGGFSSFYISISGTYNSAAYTQGSQNAITTNTIGTFTGTISDSNNFAYSIYYAMSSIGDIFGSVFGLNTYGLINNYIIKVFEPSFLAIIDIVVAFVVSFDFADLLAKLLGSSSYSSQSFISKMWFAR